jgi:hypothetical protein
MESAGGGKSQAQHAQCSAVFLAQCKSALTKKAAFFKKTFLAAEDERRIGRSKILKS